MALPSVGCAGERIQVHHKAEDGRVHYFSRKASAWALCNELCNDVCKLV